MKELAEKFKQHKKEIDELQTKPESFKTHQLPLARIKKIMKSDEDVKVAASKSR
jgi:nuclear transcription factor Y gamma